MSLLASLNTEHLARRKRLWNTPPKAPDLVIVDKSLEPEQPASKTKQAVEPASIVDNRMPTIREIQHVVCRRFDITYHDIISDRRDAKTVFPRQIAYWLARHMTMATITKIGGRFGDRDHTTILHGISQIQIRQERDLELAAVLHSLKTEITELVARGGLIAEVK